MPILVTIIKAPELANVAEPTKTFDEQGGSLGRGKDNSWILDDPERFLSSCHCQISNENGLFYITDLSTNGTFFNGAANPMGRGTKLPLNDGNVFVLGEYEFSVSADAVIQNAHSDPFSASPEDVFSTDSSADSFAQSDNNPFGGGHVSSTDSLFTAGIEETDPLAALDKAQGGSQGFPHSVSSGFSDALQTPPASDPFAGATFSDKASPLNEQISWPDSVPEKGVGIPDDWDDDLHASSAPASVVPPVQAATSSATPPVVPAPAVRQEAPASQSANASLDEGRVKAMQLMQKENERIQSELTRLKQQISAQKHSVQSDVSVDTTLIEAIGFHHKNLLDEEITQINKVVGEVVREMVGGLMQVLSSRSSIKNEFRMNVTTIQPVENNPLKFSANIDDALENMFIKQGDAYKKPVEAVKEGFQGVAEHQVAILAGIRAAFKGVIERFDPLLLEQRFAKQKKIGIIPGSQKAKNWELYLEYYNELAGDIDNSFQYLFGDEFVKAYEDQLQKLAIARKTHKTEK